MPYCSCSGFLFRLHESLVKGQAFMLPLATCLTHHQASRIVPVTVRPLLCGVRLFLRLLSNLPALPRKFKTLAESKCPHQITILPTTGWRTIISLLQVTARHPRSNQRQGYETISFIMADGPTWLPAIMVLCITQPSSFAGAVRVGDMINSVNSLGSDGMVSLVCSCEIGVSRDDRKLLVELRPP
nr:ARF guanine-nucleotide exchange factor GNOM-like [Ipomoea batatas]